MVRLASVNSAAGQRGQATYTSWDLHKSDHIYSISNARAEYGRTYTNKHTHTHAAGGAIGFKTT